MIVYNKYTSSKEGAYNETDNPTTEKHRTGTSKKEANILPCSKNQACKTLDTATDHQRGQIIMPHNEVMFFILERVSCIVCHDLLYAHEVIEHNRTEHYNFLAECDNCHTIKNTEMVSVCPECNEVICLTCIDHNLHPCYTWTERIHCENCGEKSIYLDYFRQEDQTHLCFVCNKNRDQNMGECDICGLNQSIDQLHTCKFCNTTTCCDVCCNQMSID